MGGRRHPAAVAIVAALAAIPAVAAAQHAVVTADEVLALMKGRKAVVVDARTPAEYRQAHIPRALNLPPEQLKAEAARLPRDRATPLVFYCRGPG